MLTRVPLNLFYSYAHEDAALREQLEIHLSLLRRQGLISEWHDRKIVAGTPWAQEIDAHLERASIILLLISPNFLASDYCYDIELQRALERHEQNEARVIPIILRPCDWQHALFAHLQALPHDGKAVTEWGNQDAAFRNIARGIRTATEQFPALSPQLELVSAASRTPPTASTRTPIAPTDRNRQRMLKRVHATWIAGVLEKSLHGAALMVLGLEEKVDVLDNPWRLLMQEVDHPAQLLPEGTRITQVYHATEGGILILGEPGAGKTTLLLELLRDLLDRAQTSENAPIPVVFNLSSWAKKRLALGNWLIEELSIRYEVPHKLGQSWVNEERLLLLLDGLDEVAPAARKECIETINSYRETHPDVQIVVCSRSTEYLNAPTQLRLQSAVVIQPLTQEQIDSYLESIGEQAEALRKALRQDTDLRELATTPLMLTILLFGYKETSLDKISELTNLEAKREQIFASYVQHMLKRRGALQRYKPEQITHWLTYLGQQMKRQNQTLFYIEQMQPGWLPKLWQRFVYRALASVLLGELLGWLFLPLLRVLVNIIIIPFLYIFYKNLFYQMFFSFYALVTGFIGLFVGLFYRKGTEIRTAEVITWSWAKMRWATITSIISGLLGCLGYLVIFSLPLHFTGTTIILLYTLIFVLTGGTCSTLTIRFSRRSSHTHKPSVPKQEIWYPLCMGVLIGAITSFVDLGAIQLGSPTINPIIRHIYQNSVFYYIYTYIYFMVIVCIVGSIIGLFYGVSTGQLETRNTFKPNQGIWYSLYNGGRVLLIVGSIVLPISEIVTVLSYGNYLNRISFTDLALSILIGGGISALVIGAFSGLLNGGTACIKHILLRIFLWRAKSIPWNYPRFLDYAAERILLRKVGGGYIFIHRLLLEYFASLEEK